ncbi:sugar transferase [uncultured Neptuniibacter sp.]|uniref:sugar transferase n=1 Tax=uncultured Neptuniibacter sp. TaxID=502143 RepID=UPI00260EBF02|nr:sugar transferase [uncultured Neptuniibacter sp.]
MNSYIPTPVLLAKRGMDILLSLLGLMLCLCLLPFIAAAIYLNSPGPILFKQMRIGHADLQKTDIFWMYKFRTMHLDAEAKTGAVWAQSADPRITRVGLFLRKTRLDELPQLFNVLRGDMSLIGPRPERPGFYQKLEHAIPYFSERTWGLKPGITGLAQVNQGYDRDIEDVRNKVGFDHAYALSLGSLLTWIRADLNIMMRTVLVMICGRGQ